MGVQIVRVQVLSDLHLEFQRKTEFKLEFIQRDVLILAGDVHLGSQAREFVLSQLEFSDVLMVLGNHEFYGYKMPIIREVWDGPTTEGINKEADANGWNGRLYVLDNKSVVIGDVTFIGSTLWTDFNGGDAKAMNEAGWCMNDYHKIYGDCGTITPTYTRELHQKAVTFIKNELLYDGKKVVITHHLPSEQSVSEKYSGDILNYAYYSDLDELIKTHKPNVWIHGHTHDSSDYMLGDTRVICNPRGYFPNDLNPDFNPNFTFDI